jgi:hypothetical protein
MNKYADDDKDPDPVFWVLVCNIKDRASQLTALSV